MSDLIIIPDVHQDADFLSGIIELHRDPAPAEIILLGDLLDARMEGAKTEKALTRLFDLIRDLRSDRATRLTLLWGKPRLEVLEKPVAL